MKKIERLLLLCLIYIPCRCLTEKQCVQDYKHTIIPVFITVHITVRLCPTYCNGVVWSDGCLGRRFLSIAPVIHLSASPSL